MIRTFSLLTFSSFILLFSSCSEPGTQISGTLENGAGRTVFLQSFDGNGPVDSARVADDGTFSLTTQYKKLDFYKLFLNGKTQTLVLVFDSTQKDIKITADASKLLDSYSVSGSPDSELMLEFFKLTSGIGNDPVSRMKVETQLKELAVSNKNSPAALSIISSVDIRNALPEYKTVSAALKNVIPESTYLTSMNTKIQQMDQALAQEELKKKAMAHLAKGNPAPEIALNTPEGKKLSLSSLKGKYVLIDFWASWCGPCRRENPNVVRMYEKYKKKNFEILSVSLDSSKDRWLKAIDQDKMNWLHVSDLAKWNSIAARDYGVTSIPFTVLVDPEGNIVDTKLRGAELETKLKEIFGA